MATRLPSKPNAPILQRPAKGDRALSGAGIGGAAGLVGGALVGAPVTGAAIGAAAGAGAGALTNKDQIDLGKPIWK
jgi:osmotically inducible lipoprotein OsmB